MTPEQKDIIIGIFQDGMAQGLEHPFEFFTAFIRDLCHYDYRRISEMEEKAYDAMIAFMKNTAGCTEEQEMLDKLDVIKLNDLISNWYKYHYKRLDEYYQKRKKEEGVMV